MKVSFLVEIFDRVWAAQKNQKREKEFAKFLLQKLAATGRDEDLTFAIDGVEVSLLPATPDPIELAPTKEELLKRELERVRTENLRLKIGKAKKAGAVEEIEALRAMMPQGLTVQEIADRYGITSQTVRNNIAKLERIGDRINGSAGKPPAIYSEASIEALAKEKNWVQKPEGDPGKVLVEMLEPPAPAQNDGSG